MADFEDVPLQRSAADEPPPPPRSKLWLATAALLVIGLGVWYFAFRAPRDVKVATETAPVADTAPPAARLPAEPGDAIDLPPLDASDPVVRDLIARLSSHPRVAAWLTTNGLVRNFAVVTVNIADGRGPADHLKPVTPTGAFQARTDGGTVTVDPRSYSRYDGHAEAVGALDAQGVARLYATLKPRIDDASKELGVANFDATLERAIIALLRTPIVEGDVRLNADSVSYKFADPALESLTPAQRQFLRMGPRNMRIVQGKLREIAGHLGIPPESLPAGGR
jgi:hypothetical protein